MVKNPATVFAFFLPHTFFFGGGGPRPPFGPQECMYYVCQWQVPRARGVGKSGETKKKNRRRRSNAQQNDAIVNLARGVDAVLMIILASSRCGRRRRWAHNGKSLKKLQPTPILSPYIIQVLLSLGLNMYRRSGQESGKALLPSPPNSNFNTIPTEPKLNPAQPRLY